MNSRTWIRFLLQLPGVLISDELADRRDRCLETLRGC